MDASRFDFLSLGADSCGRGWGVGRIVDEPLSALLLSIVPRCVSRRPDVRSFGSLNRVFFLSLCRELEAKTRWSRKLKFHKFSYDRFESLGRTRVETYQGKTKPNKFGHTFPHRHSCEPSWPVRLQSRISTATVQRRPFY